MGLLYLPGRDTALPQFCFGSMIARHKRSEIKREYGTCLGAARPVNGLGRS
jgi:hypothetical protein